MASKRTPFQLRSGNSPLKVGGLILKGLKFGLKRLTPIGATAQAATDTTKDRSMGEKVLRAVDDWTTGGLGGYIYDNRKDIKKESKKVNEQRAKNSTKGFPVGQRKI